MGELPSGLVTFLFSDIEGSTRLVQSLGAGYRDVLADHHALLRAAWAQHDGTEVSTEGDGFFVVFTEPTAAVLAAAAAHRSLAAHSWPAGVTVRVRIGVHTGQGIVHADDYVGLDVHRASRIASAGHGGQTLVSDTTRDAIGELPAELRFRDLGRHRLKDVGTVRLYQLDGPGLESAFGALRSLEANPTNLPPERRDLVDREREIDRVAALLETEPVVTLTGPGGIGKSRVAVRAARAVLARFPDGVFYADTSPLDRAELVVAEIGRAVGMRAEPAFEELVEVLRDRTSLLVLDGTDRVADLGRVVATLVDRCARLRVLTTSRGRLHIAAETAVPVGPLASSWDDGAPAPPAAVELFLRRARAVRPSFELTPADAVVLADVCERLDGLPLAIELAASRVRLLPPADLRARLERRLPLLTGGDRDAPDRQRTLRDTIAWSYELLAPDERRLLQRLAVFAGSFDLAGAEAVARLGDHAESVADVLSSLEALIDRSLVAVADEADDRFLLLGTIREFARDELEASGDGQLARRRHAEHWLEFARRHRAALEGADDLTAVATLEREMDEFRAAHRWAIRASPPMALALAATLGRFLWLRAHVREGSAWLGEALAPDSGDDAERAAASYWSGALLDARGMADEARARYEEAVARFRSAGDAWGEARAITGLGTAYTSLGDFDRAEALLRDSLERKRALGDERGVATSLTNLGIVEAARGRWAAARPYFEEALQLDRAAGARASAAYSEMGLGAVHARAGELDAAETALRSSLGVFATLEDDEGVSECLLNLGHVARERGRPLRALRLYLVAAALLRHAGIPAKGDADGSLDDAIRAVSSTVDPVEATRVAAEADAFDLAAAVGLGLEGNGAASPGSVSPTAG